jgi:hypothetical protein
MAGTEIDGWNRMSEGIKKRLLKWVFDRYIHWRIEELVRPGYPVLLEYPINPEPRWGEGRPPHPEIASLLAERDEIYLHNLGELAQFRDLLTHISESASGPVEPHWDNTYFSALDAIALYGLLGARRPRRYLEIGSGNSTKFARRAIRDLQLPTRITSIDPAPRANVDMLCDELIRMPLEAVQTEIVTGLEPGDVLFVDSSHRVFANGDVTVLFIEILPRLRPGVIVHIHDVFLPYDYPRIWSKRHYSEQYLLAAYLLAGCAWIDVLLPLAYASVHTRLTALVNDTWSQAIFQRAFAHYRRLTGSYIGTSFWIRVQGPTDS